MKNIIVANWKMNPTSLAEAKKIFSEVQGKTNIETIICPPFVYLPSLNKSSMVKLGAQDCSWKEEGAYTGDISPKMLKSLGAEYVIIGHSERRKYHNETYVVINKKIDSALKSGLKVILCIENISQLKKSASFKNLIVSYEPVFAIGTGNPCSPQRAKRARELIQRNLSGNIPILYGGSTNSKNAKSYIKEAGFNGLLVGGASLVSKEFNKMINEVK